MITHYSLNAETYPCTCDHKPEHHDSLGGCVIAGCDCVHGMPRLKPPKSVECHPDTHCPNCQIPLVPEHAHMKCPQCGMRDSCCF